MTLLAPTLQGFVPIGTLLPYAGATSPTNWLLCDGAAVSRTTYAELFNIIGTAYGAGDGSTTFGLPDLRGRAPVGKDDMGGSAASRLTSGVSGVDGTTIGASGGAQSHTLTAAQMPSHTHTGSGTTSTTNTDHTHSSGNGQPIATHVGGYSTAPSGVGAATVSGIVGTTGGMNSNAAHSHTFSFTTSAAGSTSAHNNVQPVIVTNYIIRVL